MSSINVDKRVTLVQDSVVADPAEPLLTVIVPVYNEVNSLETILDRVHHAPYDKQIIVVDDGSTDGTTELLRKLASCSPIEAHFHAKNRGKGAAIRTALEFAKGQYTIIQDGDLEYDPQDYPKLLEPLLAGEADVVYGSRYLNRDNDFSGRWSFDLGVKLLNFLVWCLYGTRITDEATCYKVFPTVVLREMGLRCERFEFCPEVTAKALRLKLRLREVPIDYESRSVNAGKKIRFRDGIAAVATLWEYRKWRLGVAGTEGSPAYEDEADANGTVDAAGEYCARACRVIVSLLLFGTAILKFHAVVVDHAGIHLGPFPPWVLLASGVVECVVAVQLTRTRFRAVSTVAGLACFVVFLAVGGVVWLRGFGSCGCLGVISSSILVTSIMSASAIAILWFTRPKPFVPCVAKECNALARERPLHWPVMAMLSLLLITGVLGTAAGRQYLGLPSFQTIVAEPIELPTVRAGSWIVGEVKITNQSAERCKIIGQKASCNCILVGALPDSIPPRETVSVPVKIKAPDIAGRLEKVIVIYLRHPSQFTVSCFVRGRVVAASKA